MLALNQNEHEDKEMRTWLLYYRHRTDLDESTIHLESRATFSTVTLVQCQFPDEDSSVQLTEAI